MWRQMQIRANVGYTGAKRYIEVQAAADELLGWEQTMTNKPRLAHSMAVPLKEGPPARSECIWEEKRGLVVWSCNN